jgi:hypothetical protein
MEIFGLDRLIRHLKQPKFQGEILRAAFCCPEVIEDADIEMFVRALLVDPNNAIRRTAAWVLAKAGKPEGIKHLAYNAVSKHPILGADQTNYETQQNAKSVLLRYVDKLDSESVSLILEDAINPSGNVYLDVLALLPLDLIESDLSKTDNDRAKTIFNYVLARHNIPQSFEFLASLLKEKKHIQLALVGLSHMPDTRGSELLKTFCNKENGLYAGVAEKNAERIQKMFQARALIAETFLSNDWLKLYADIYNYSGTQEPSKDSHICFSPNTNRKGFGIWPNMPTLLIEFQFPDIQHELLNRQMLALEYFLGKDQTIPREVFGSTYKQEVENLIYESSLLNWDVRINVEREDEINFATSWITDPIRFQEGSLFPGLSLFGKAEERIFY